VTATVTATFVASVVFEVAFCFALGLSLADIPVTLQDFTKNAVVTWLPYTAATVGGVAAYRVIVLRWAADDKPRELPQAKGCLGVVD